MQPEPFFSIIIPTYNRGNRILPTLQSCLSQSFKDFEIIVVDDGSTDNTAEIIAHLGSEKIKYHPKKNEERAIARNFGVQQAKGKYVTFLDSDDLYLPGMLEKVYERITTNGYPEFYNQAYRIVNEQNKTIDTRVYSNDDLYVLVKGNPFSCVGNFVKTEVCRQYPFETRKNIIRSEDWELWIRLAARYGYKSDNTVLCQLIDHDDRSVRNIDPAELVNHKITAIETAFEDPYVKQKFGRYRKRILAFAKTYISLHLALAGYKKMSLKYLAGAFAGYPGCIFDRRFLAIVKHVMFSR